MSNNKLISYSSISELPIQAQDFIAANDNGSVFLTVPWLKNLEETVFNKNKICIYVLENSHGETQAVLPCLKFSDTLLGISGNMCSSMTNYYSSHFSPIIDQNSDRKTQQQTLTELIASIKATNLYNSFDFSQLDKNETSFKYFTEAAENSKYTVEPYFCFGNWYLELNNRSFDEYYNNLSSRLRNTIKRKTKKLEKEHTYRIQFITNETELGKYIDDYNKIYHKSWKNKEPFPDFIPNLVNVAAKEGWLRMGILYVNEKPAASQLWFIYKGTANIYKLAYDEEFSKYSVGSILSKYLFELVIDKDKVHTMDYLTGDDSYKQDWMSHRRERWGFRAYDNASLFGVLNTIKYKVKNLLIKQKQGIN